MMQTLEERRKQIMGSIGAISCGAGLYAEVTAGIVIGGIMLSLWAADRYLEMKS
jgi:hypothetical protein